MKSILISDPTLRDGNHAVAHQLSAKQIATYCEAADKAAVPIVEVGHGNGLGASSLQVGESKETDVVLLETAKAHLHTSKLGIHVIPGFATINRDLKRAIEIGVDVIRVASHCTEADITQRHLGYSREKGKETYGVLMMSHMASADLLVEEAQKMELYGAEGIIIMDSAGAYLPSDVTERISALVEGLSIPIGFHGHNNLGLGIANSIAAVEAGATMLDGTARGFGAGAGNAQLEVLIAVLAKMGYTTGIDLYKILDAADIAEREIMPLVPIIKSESIVSGLAGVFSGFSKHVTRISNEYKVDQRDVYFELGRRKVVAGQEDLIIEVVLDLVKRKKK
ncbi:4-hydroxy-2-oxovalerate aldolase [Mucilaginibacter sp. X5P1]|uniref:4-hydroxy-2-oxovalerate aldolase n=1 Tax=Mucilaginibacter sp. X5P1 TaxID=2723088 RepID=UPI0016168304|nr:4-hydroxy-2-oxovalerate aldolase [Mucilaginibacter sp. X5P1]MBB6141218.1 4-hydroxy 2-oxovalerate aldolase [Mucilaginibacter sp. X5P1]